ncbi:MAG: DUF992 domain-containing protein [Pseudomonadota bacterium]
MTIRNAFLYVAICGVASTLGLAGLAQPVSSPERGLYENLDVLGVLDCEVRADIRLIVGTESSLRCDYTPVEGYDVLKRYSGYVRALTEGLSYREGDYVCWNVLFMRGDETPADHPNPIIGAYSSPVASIVEKYELKAGALVGGSKKTFALEPRCEPVERAGRNIADAISAFDLAG